MVKVDINKLNVWTNNGDTSKVSPSSYRVAVNTAKLDQWAGVKPRKPREENPYHGMMIDPGLAEAYNARDKQIEGYGKWYTDKLLEALYPVARPDTHVTQAAVDALEKQVEEAKAAKQGISSILMATPDNPTLDAVTGNYVSNPYWLDLNKQYEEADKKLQELEKQFNETRDKLHYNEQGEKRLNFENARDNQTDYQQYINEGGRLTVDPYDAGKTWSGLFDGSWFDPYTHIKTVLYYINDPVYKNYLDAEMRVSGNYKDVDYWRTPYMTEREKDTLRYYAGKGDWQAAQDYFDTIKSDLGEKRALVEDKKEQDWANKNPLLAAGKNIIAAPWQAMSAAATFAQGIKNEITDEYEPIDRNSMFFNPAHTVANTTEGITRDMLGFGKWAAQTGLSIGQYASVLPFGPAVSLAIMSTSSAGATAYDALERGATPEQAMQVAAIAGVTEALTEKIPLNNLFKIFNSGSKVTVKQAFLNMAKQAGQEGFEEFVSAYADIIADNAVMGDKSNLNLLIEEYAAQGYSGEEAARRAMLQTYIWDPLSQAAAGGLTGFAMAGTGHVGKIDYSSGRTNTAAQNTQAQQNVPDADNVDYLNDWYGTDRRDTAGYSTSINTNPAEHTAAEQNTITNYKKSVDSGLVSFVKRVRTLVNKSYRDRVRYTISPVQNNQIEAINRLVDIDVTGFENIISGSTIDHIENRHGANGKADHSMKDINDVARIGYILNNFDSARLLVDASGKPLTNEKWRNSNNTPSPLIEFTKKINGTYFIVEAIPDSQAKVLAVISAYMSKADRNVGLELGMSNKDLQHTSETNQGANNPAADNIPQNVRGVNQRDIIGMERNMPNHESSVEANNEYASAVNDELLDLSIQLQYTEPEAGALTLGSISNEAAAGIKKMTGFNTAGFETVIEQDAVKQIINEHGKTGTIDQSMMDINDIARMQYVIDNYDTVVKGGVIKPTPISPASLRSPSDSPWQGESLIFEKKVNGTYYVVEAVPDKATKTLNIVSAYMSETSKVNDMRELVNESVQGYNGNGLVNEPNEGAGKTFIDSVPKMRVGQWMSKAEYEQFLKTGEIPRTNVLTKGMDGYIKQANKGDFYVEFDIDPSLLAPKNEALGWSLIKPKNQMYIKLYQNKGLSWPDPIGYNISHVYTK